MALGGGVQILLRVCITMVTLAKAQSLTTELYANDTMATAESTELEVTTGTTTPATTTEDPVALYVQACLETFEALTSEGFGFRDSDYNCLCVSHCSGRPILEVERHTYVDTCQNYPGHEYEYADSDRFLINSCVDSMYETLHFERQFVAYDYFMICCLLDYDYSDTGLADAWNAAFDAAGEELVATGRPYLVAALVIALLAGIIGNSVVIATVHRYMGKTSVTNIFIGNLAAVDLLVILICTPMRFTDLYPWGEVVFDHNPVPCRIYFLFYYASFFISIFLMCAMAMERYLVIVFPMKARYLSTAGRAKLIVLMTWILGLLLAIPIQFVLQMHNCGYYWFWGDTLAVFIYMLMVGYVVPLAILLFAYGHIAWVLYKSIKIAKSLKGGDGSGKNDDDTSGRIKVVRMLVMVVIVFAIVWGPQTIGNVIFAADFRFIVMEADFGPFDEAQFRVLTNIISIYGSVLNPFLYACMSKPFRRGFFRALTCGRRGQEPLPSTASSSGARTVSTSAAGSVSTLSRDPESVQGSTSVSDIKTTVQLK